MQNRIRVGIISLLLLLVIGFAGSMRAQDLDCTVRVNYESVSNTNKDLLVNFENDVRDYINNYKWGQDNLDERIKCTFDINIQSVVGQDRYAAQVFIGSSRPIYNSEQNSVILRLFDEAWEFTYVRGRPITHSTFTFNDLASFLDFYSYLIIGYDYDTFDALNGTPHFQRAADIASLARSSGGKGWQTGKGSNFSRVQLIEEILNTKFAPVRRASYMYHFTGLDSMAVAREKAYANIAESIRMIGEVKRSADARNQIIKTFFEAKYQEVSELFVGYSDPKIFLDLVAADPAHQATYEEYRRRSR